MRIAVTPHAPADALLARYAAGDAFLASRLGGDPRAPASFHAALARCRRRAFPRAELAERLHAANRALGAAPLSLDNARALAAPDVFAVACGQQPGFATGPLYTLLKAATTIALARRLTQQLGVRCVPLFWIASDDHDLPEIEGCALLDAHAELRRFRVDLGPAGPPAARLCVPEAAPAVFEQLAAALPDGPHLERVRAELAPRAGERWPDWFGRTLLRLFASSGLVVFEPRHVADLLLPLLLRELEAPARVPAALQAGARALAQRGLSAPLRTDLPSAVFHVEQNRRRRVAPGRDDARALCERARGEPDALSGDAGLRAILQALILPAPVVTGGPGELAYWLQLSEAFDLLEAPRPVFVPRTHATLVEPRVRRASENLALGQAELFLGEEALARRVPPPDPERDAALRGRAQDALSALDRFARELADAGAPVRGSLEKLQAAFQASLDKLRRQALEEEQERAGVSLRRALLVARAFLPAGKPQDRVLSGLQFLPRHGLDLYDRLAATIDPFEFGHLLVDLGDTEPAHG